MWKKLLLSLLFVKKIVIVLFTLVNGISVHITNKKYSYYKQYEQAQ